MNKKIILLSLLLLNLKMMCSEIKVMPPALKYEISYDDAAINTLIKSNAAYPKYGFEGASLSLNLNEKHGRGFISQQNQLLERLVISKEQASKLIDFARKKSHHSSNADFKSTQYFFYEPIDIMVRKDKTPIFYRIYTLRHINTNTIDEAGYNSGLENRQESFLAGGALGTIIGLVVGGAAATIFMYCVALKTIFSR